jgi:hypothetical protein
MTVFVYGFRDKTPPDVELINTTSRSDSWTTGLSPFFLGPCELYGDYVCTNVENGWQYSKCYSEHVDAEGNPTPDYFKWALKGWCNERAVRYPMGKGRKPLYSWWNGEKLDYVTARKKVYIPLYAKAVYKTEAYKKLKKKYKDNGEVHLLDFDGYDYIRMGKTLNQVFNDPNKKAGHAFVLAWLLTNNY